MDRLLCSAFGKRGGGSTQLNIRRTFPLSVSRSTLAEVPEMEFVVILYNAVYFAFVTQHMSVVIRLAQ